MYVLLFTLNQLKKLLSHFLAVARSPSLLDILLLSLRLKRYDTGCYFNVRSKADMSQLNLPHGANN